MKRKAKEEQERADREAEEEEDHTFEGDENKNDDDNDASDIEYEIFYDQQSIKRTYKEQRKDVFKDIMNDRRFVYSKHKGFDQLRETTKYKIENYAPKMDDESFNTAKNKFIKTTTKFDDTNSNSSE